MIKINDTVEWDESADMGGQSEEAFKWLYEEIYPIVNENDKAELDEWERPYKWTINGDGWQTVVIREYRDKDRGTWAMNKDNIIVSKI